MFLNWLYTVLTEIGIDFNAFLNDKNERIKAQKYCYILNKFYNLLLMVLFHYISMGHIIQN